MIPILFTQGTTSFTTNGIGRLADSIYCKTKEELNGAYELELQYPITGKYFSSIVNSAIIGVIPYDGCTNIQGFRIYSITKPINGKITVYAEHISYQRYWIPVMPFSASSLSDCLSKLKSNSVESNPFTLYTDKTVVSSIAFTEPQDLGTMLQGEQGSVLQTYKGQYEYDNYTIKLLNKRGTNNNVTLRYGKNIIDFEQEENIENTYTGIVPYWTDADGNMVTLSEKVVQSSQASAFPYKRTKVMDFSSEFEEKPTEAQLRTFTQQYITNNNIGHPNVNITLDFVALWQTKEYENIAPIERVKLGDTVTVVFEKLGITEQSSVVAYEYDVLREKYDKIQIGEIKSTLAQTIAEQNNYVESVKTDLKDSISNATSWLTRGDGYLKIVKGSDGSWRELLAMDSPSDKTAKKVLRLNQYGIGFSDSGVDGPYRQAWTLDGVFSTGGINDNYGKIIVRDNSSNNIGEWNNTGLAVRATKLNETDSTPTTTWLRGSEGGLSIYDTSNPSGRRLNMDQTAMQIRNSDSSKNRMVVTPNYIRFNKDNYKYSTVLTMNSFTAYEDSKETAHIYGTGLIDGASLSVSGLVNGGGFSVSGTNGWNGTIYDLYDYDDFSGGYWNKITVKGGLIVDVEDIGDG